MCNCIFFFFKNHTFSGYCLKKTADFTIFVGAKPKWSGGWSWGEETAPPMNSIVASPSPSHSLPIFIHKNSSPPLLISRSFTSPPIPRSSPYSPLRVSSSSSDNSPVTVPSPPTDAPLDTLRSASQVVRDFYHGINRRDLTSVEALIAENCVYEDLIFSRPFVGRKVRYPPLY